jgi:hypothetical protein
MDEMFRELERLRRYGEMLQDLVNESLRSAPQRAEGTDPTGSVRTVLGPDGLPETIRVSPYWNQKLRPEEFAGAVNAACQAAAQQRGAEWAETMRRSGWQDRIQRLDQDATAAAAATAAEPNPVPPAYRRPDSRPPKSLDDLAEEAISLMDSGMSLASHAGPPRSPRGTGADRSGTLEIRVSADGQVACRADPRWVAQQSGAQLSMALASVLATAREKLTAEVGAAAANDPSAKIKSAAETLQREILAAMSGLQEFGQR